MPKHGGISGRFRGEKVFTLIGFISSEEAK